MPQLIVSIGALVAATGLAVSVLFTYHVADDDAFTLASVKIGDTTHDFTTGSGQPQCISGSEHSGFNPDKTGECTSMIGHASSPLDKLTCGGLTAALPAGTKLQPNDAAGMCSTACAALNSSKSYRMSDAGRVRVNSAMAGFVQTMSSKAPDSDCSDKDDATCKVAFEDMFNGVCGRKHWGETEFRAPKTTFRLDLHAKTGDGTKHKFTLTLVGSDATNKAEYKFGFTDFSGEQTPYDFADDVKKKLSKVVPMDVHCMDRSRFYQQFEAQQPALTAYLAQSMTCWFTPKTFEAFDKISHVKTAAVWTSGAAALAQTKNYFTLDVVDAADAAVAAGVDTDVLQEWSRTQGAIGGTLVLKNFYKSKPAGLGNVKYTLKFTQAAIPATDGVTVDIGEKFVEVKDLTGIMTDDALKSRLNAAFGEDLVLSVKRDATAKDEVTIVFSGNAVNPPGDLLGTSVVFTRETGISPADLSAKYDAGVTTAVAAVKEITYVPTGLTKPGTAYETTFDAATAHKAFACGDTLKRTDSYTTPTDIEKKVVGQGKTKQNCPLFMIGTARQSKWAAPWKTWASSTNFGTAGPHYTTDELLNLHETWGTCMASDPYFKTLATLGT
ncbi:MAG: hypothetical protein VW491_03155, partial [Gammaproteobacteria bacterium]